MANITTAAVGLSNPDSIKTNDIVSHLRIADQNLADASITEGPVTYETGIFNNQLQILIKNSQFKDDCVHRPLSSGKAAHFGPEYTGIFFFDTLGNLIGVRNGPEDGDDSFCSVTCNPAVASNGTVYLSDLCGRVLALKLNKNITETRTVWKNDK